MIKVSIIVPAYNTENYIKNCVESLINQSLKEIEIIIVDDGSVDNTLQLLREYEDKYPSMVRVLHKENGGQASARNLALPYAKGEYLGFIDSDDWVDSEMYERMYQQAKIEGSDIVVCDMVEYFPDKQVYHDCTNVSNKFGFAGSSCNKIFRREFAEGIKFPEGLWYEDFEYSAIQLMKTDNVSVLHEGLYHYNCVEGSTMHNNNAQKNKDILTVINHIYSYAQKNGWEEKYGEELEYLYIDHILLTTINRLEEQNNKEKREVIDFLRHEVNRKYPCFYKDKVYQEFTTKQRVVAYLNAKGLSFVSKLIFMMKRMVKK